MIINKNVSPSKILLFGEYSVLVHSNALAIPFSKYSGQLVYANKHASDNPEIIKSNEIIQKFYAYLKVLEKKSPHLCVFDFKTFEADIHKMLYFKSNIPEQYGLGSSGALTAQVFSSYALHPQNYNLNQLKNIFAGMESFFHGKSSGTDPLVSFVNKPIIFMPNEIKTTELNFEDLNRDLKIFFIDTNRRAGTIGFVAEFQNKIKTDSSFRKKIELQYIPIVNNTIEKFINYKSDDFIPGLKELVKLQIELFWNLFPENIVKTVQYGIEKDLYYLKLCGSGGGGYLLGFTTKPDETFNYLQKSVLNVEKLENFQ